MEKKCLFIVSVLVTALAVAGCGSAPSTPKVYDPSVPLEQSSTLMMSNNVGIIKFNDKNVALMGSIIIPADSHSWILRYKDREDDGLRVTGVTQYDISMTYTFLPEHTYHVTATASGGNATGHVTDVTRFTVDLPTPDTTNPNASPFEGEWVGVQINRVLTITKDEWASKDNGKYSSRGLVSYNGKNATLLIMAAYDTKKGKWTVYNPSILQEFHSLSAGAQRAVMKDNTLIINDSLVFRKVE